MARGVAEEEEEEETGCGRRVVHGVHSSSTESEASKQLSHSAVCMTSVDYACPGSVVRSRRPPCAGWCRMAKLRWRSRMLFTRWVSMEFLSISPGAGHPDGTDPTEWRRTEITS